MFLRALIGFGSEPVNRFAFNLRMLEKPSRATGLDIHTHTEAFKPLQLQTSNPGTCLRIIPFEPYLHFNSDPVIVVC